MNGFKAFVKRNKKAVALIVAGLIAIGGSYLGLTEDQQQVIVEIIVNILG